VLVIWPSNRTLAVINMAGLEATLPYLKDLIAKWQAAGPKGGLLYQHQAQELAGYMLLNWAAAGGYERSEPTEMERMLRVLARLGEVKLVRHARATDRSTGPCPSRQFSGPRRFGRPLLRTCSRAAKSDRGSPLVDALGACAALLNEH
jgi:hypothetical protein